MRSSVDILKLIFWITVDHLVFYLQGVVLKGNYFLICSQTYLLMLYALEVAGCGIRKQI